MKRFKAFVVAAILVLTAAAAMGRLWYTEDIKMGTSTSVTSDGLPLSALNASKIPLTTGSNIEVVLTSLQSQITALSAQLALKASLASPEFTGAPVLPASTTIGVVSGTEISWLSGVTSGIQTQLDAKAAKDNATITGTLTVTGAITALQFLSSGAGPYKINLCNADDNVAPVEGDLWGNCTDNVYKAYLGGAVVTVGP